MSYSELLVQLLPFALFLLVGWLLLGRSFLRRLLAGLREKKIYRREHPWIARESPTRFALPYVVVIWCFLLVSGIVFGPSSSEIKSIGDSSINAYRFFATLPFLIIAVVIHLRPNHSRELKYTLLLGSIPAVTLFLSGPYIRDQFVTADFSIASFVFLSIYLILVIVMGFWWVVVVIAISLLLKAGTIARSRPIKIQRYIFSFLRMPSVGFFVLPSLFFAPAFAIIFLTGRFVFGEAFRRHPIVYLRSFRYERSAATFGRALAPALAPFGIIQALVHESQTGRILLSKSSIWQFGMLATVPNALWQGWVEGAIRNCSLVLIDCSVQTESVEWEIETALRETDPARVLVITTGQTADVATTGATILSYSTDKGGIKQLRAQVSFWAEKTLQMDLRKARWIAACFWGFLFLVPIISGIIFSLLGAGEQPS